MHFDCLDKSDTMVESNQWFEYSLNWIIWYAIPKHPVFSYCIQLVNFAREHIPPYLFLASLHAKKYSSISYWISVIMNIRFFFWWNNEHKIDHIHDPWIIYQKHCSQNKVLTNIAIHVYEWGKSFNTLHYWYNVLIYAERKKRRWKTRTKLWFIASWKMQHKFSDED